ncbi:hypothetical protein [Gilvimarinus algae]|uniref:DUF4845 domain-containing protein n=1 Tax=Gilvimarinus algae TaxID=3058037 RepID=A0ABT8TEB6_9GAMM|nr:hypothetical protein [Gilvimarinus sp. SDUM040014]MDO3380637.1 hypothetical protein [Gilvimarinus sp. SDUM040014]
MSRKTPLGQLIVFILIAAGIIVLSIGSTLYFTGVPMGEFGQKMGEAIGLNYKHATMTDAQLVCKEHMQRKFSGRIRVLHVDSRSSRRDDEEGLFKIFIEADIYADSDRVGPTRELFVSCFVYAQSGKIERFQFAGDSEEQIGPDGEEATNYFGL